ncbi:MAG TPA: hypothetical protein VH044_00690 [Polyangiaceae bacterium]|jgi:hypothetical protein|nr:hypothetical protein [Polyangiaceae bacterium]
MAGSASSVDARPGRVDAGADAGRTEVVLLQRPYILRLVGLVCAVAGAAIGLASRSDMKIVWIIGLGMLGLVLVVIGGEGTQRRIRASLGVDGVRVGGRVALRRGAFRAAWVEQDADGTRIRLRRRFLPDLRVEATDEHDAGSLLARMGLAPLQSVMRFGSRRSGAVVLGTIVGQVMARGVFEVNHATAVASCAMYVVVAVAFYLLMWQQLAVGCDGVLLRGPFARRFLPFADIESAFCEESGRLVLRTHAGEILVRRLDPSAAQAVVWQIQTGVGQVQAAPETVKRQLRREGDVTAWLARLRALAIPGSYREAGVAGEVLWRVLEEPGATASERAAAAVAIGAFATPEERVRLRVAAARVASPRVRVAIERVADPTDEAELAEAMAAVEESAA